MNLLSQWVLDNTVTTELNWAETNMLLIYLDAHRWHVQPEVEMWERYLKTSDISSYGCICHLKSTITWCCKEHFHSGISEAACCLLWPHESWLPFHLQRTGQVSKWSPAWKGQGPESHLDTLCTPVEGRSTVVAEIHWACNPAYNREAHVKPYHDINIWHRCQIYSITISSNDLSGHILTEICTL